MHARSHVTRARARAHTRTHTCPLPPCLRPKAKGPKRRKAKAPEPAPDAPPPPPPYQPPPLGICYFTPPLSLTAGQRLGASVSCARQARRTRPLQVKETARLCGVSWFAIEGVVEGKPSPYAISDEYLLGSVLRMGMKAAPQPR